MSRKASRTLINNHHQLEKKRRQAAERGDHAEKTRIEQELAEMGGLKHYQQASLQGQSQDRGGDTSKVLLEWLPVADMRKLGSRFRLLEVGALSMQNACSTSGLFDIVHIDLNSQEAGILQQDFMERPLPADNTEKFDIISLSLVLNFVPDASTRGLMLGRTLSFLQRVSENVSTNTFQNIFPSLFVVLPRSCLDNSRYFTDTRFEEIMTALGYTKIRSKLTQKLAYSLWRWSDATHKLSASFPKKELNPGRSRNNFVITLKTTGS